MLLFLILPPKSGLRLLSYCCKRLFNRNVTFWTVWTLRVAFILEEMVVGASKDLTEPPPDPFVFRGGGTDHFSFALLLGKTLALVKWPFWVFGITAMPLLNIKCELRSYANVVSRFVILLYFHYMINHLFLKIVYYLCSKLLTFVCSNLQWNSHSKSYPFVQMSHLLFCFCDYLRH